MTTVTGDFDRGEWREVTRAERGWPGHFVSSHKCTFRRNTLLECAGTGVSVVVSTVGCMHQESRSFTINGKGKVTSRIENVGVDRSYETMAFHSKREGSYLEADVERNISLTDLGLQWCVDHKEGDPLPEDCDIIANDMHEAAVAGVTTAMLGGNRFEDDRDETDHTINGEA